MIINKTPSIIWTIVEYAFYIFFILFPFINYGSYLYTGTSTRAVNFILFTTLLGICLAVWLFKKKNSLTLTLSPIIYPLIGYIAILLISALGGLNFSTSWWSVTTRMTGIWYFINLGFFMILLSALMLDEVRQKRLIVGIVISTALYSLLSFMGPEGLGWIFKNYPYDGFSFGNSTFAGMYIFGAFLLSLYHLSQASIKKWWMYILPVLLIINPNIINREVWFGNFSSGLVGEARTSSYAILFSLIGMIIFWGISKIKSVQIKARVSYSVFGLGIIVMIVGAYSLLSPTGYIRHLYLSQATAARPLVWEISQHAIAERPLLGWGSDNFERVFEKKYDNRLLQDEYGNEAWFDRAHNVFIDQMVDNGIIGFVFYLSIYLVIIYFLIHPALHSIRKNDRVFAILLILYFTLHFVELQTAFDTSISYIMVAFMIVAAAVLIWRTREQENKNKLYTLNGMAKNIVGGIILVFFCVLFMIGLFPFMRAQSANGIVRTIGSAEKRIPLYPTLLSSSIDPHAFLWRTATDFQRGIGANPAVLEDPKKVELLKKEIVILEQGYRDYIAEYPDHFRAHLNLADVLIYQRLFGVDKLEEAQVVLDEAIKLVPQSPQPYWMKAVGYIYMRKFDLAREYAQKAYDLNPAVKQSTEVKKYVEDSIKTFPDIDLYFFKQI